MAINLSLVIVSICIPSAYPLVNMIFFLTIFKGYESILAMADKKNLLVISDAVAGTSGLARITRDLCTRIHEHLGDTYRLATAGYGSPGSCKFGWQQYSLEGMSEWVLPTLPEIVQDFAGNERCIVMFICDAHRVSWFSQPERLGGESLAKFPGLAQWLLKANIEKWLYCPIDSSGPNDKLSYPIALTLLGFDRLLAYGQFGEDVIRRTIGDAEADKRNLTHLPHGICSETFYELPRKLSRKLFLEYTGAQSLFHMLGVPNATTAPIADDEVLIGVIATNQSRKDWAMALEVCSILSRTRKIRVWLHTDDLERYWSIPNLLVDYGLLDRAVISIGMIPDERMASAYSACDLTIGPGSEGFGYPIHESLFCGTPCIHMNYAGAPEWMMDPNMIVEPVAFRYEGSYASKRPVFRAEDWATKAEKFIGARMNHNGNIDWANLWPRWEYWFREAEK